jgi:DNA-binding NarL/FixJ family response regulator
LKRRVLNRLSFFHFFNHSYVIFGQLLINILPAPADPINICPKFTISYYLKCKAGLSTPPGTPLADFTPCKRVSSDSVWIIIMGTKTFVVKDDHLLFKEGMRAIFRKYCPDYQLKHVRTQDELKSELSEKRYPLVLLEMRVPVSETFETIEQIRELDQKVKILVISMINQSTIIQRLFNLGISSFMYKGTSWSNLPSIIQQVLSGHLYISPEIFHEFIRDHNTTTRFLSEFDPDKELTDHEVALITLFCKQKTIPEISQQLNISAGEVEKMRINLLKKTGSSNMIGLALFALHYGLIQPEKKEAGD